jgi:hypothetical protein
MKRHENISGPEARITVEDDGRNVDRQTGQGEHCQVTMNRQLPIGTRGKGGLRDQRKSNRH